MKEKKTDVTEKIALYEIGEFLKAKSKNELELELAELSYNCLCEIGFAGSRIIPQALNTRALLVHMMEVYDASEDGDLVEYLRGFAKENAKAIKERSERGIADLPAKSNEEEARLMLAPFFQKLFLLAFKDGKMIRSSRELAKEMEFLNEIQVQKALIMATKNYLIYLDLLTKSTECEEEKKCK